MNSLVHLPMVVYQLYHVGLYYIILALGPDD